MLIPICSMVLVYLPTKLGDFKANVGKYSIHGAYWILIFMGYHKDFHRE